MKKINGVALSFSGGMDSTVLLYMAAKKATRVHAFMFDYGQRHKKELNVINFYRKQFKDITFIPVNLTFISETFKGSALLDKTINVAKAKDVMGDPQTVNYVPNRNMIFLSLLLGYAESYNLKEVWYGAAQADSIAGFYDGSVEFLNKINEIAALNRRNRIKVAAPLIDMSKADIIRAGMQLNVDFGKTWTCYEGKDKPCGECTACSLRLKGFKQLGLLDPLT